MKQRMGCSTGLYSLYLSQMFKVAATLGLQRHEVFRKVAFNEKTPFHRNAPTRSGDAQTIIGQCQ